MATIGKNRMVECVGAKSQDLVWEVEERQRSGGERRRRKGEDGGEWKVFEPSSQSRVTRKGFVPKRLRSLITLLMHACFLT